MNGSRLYEHQTLEEIAAAIERGAGAVLPLGAIEQHGHHLRLDTGSYFPELRR